MASNAVLITENTKVKYCQSYCLSTVIQKPKGCIAGWNAITARNKLLSVGGFTKRRGLQGYHGLAVVDWQIGSVDRTFGKSFTKDMVRAGTIDLKHKDVRLEHMDMKPCDVVSFHRISMIGGYLMREPIPRDCDVLTSRLKVKIGAL